MIDFAPDPVLGEYVAHHPSNRLRLLVNAGGALLVIWFVLTVALWQVDDDTALLVTVGVVGAATLIAGWYVLHAWNREVVLYERGFSYVEGSRTVFIAYADVVAVRQSGEQVAYFGGLLRRTVYRVTLRTIEEERITLTNRYNRIAELGAALEVAVLDVLRPWAEARLAAGEEVAFGELSLSATGLHHDGRTLSWAHFGGYAIGGGRITVQATDGAPWAQVALVALDNAALLVLLLKTRRVSTDKSN